MAHYHYHLLISLEVLDRLDSQTETLDISVDMSLLAWYFDIMTHYEYMDNVVILENLFRGMTKSLEYLLKRGEIKYLDQIKDYAKSIRSDYLSKIDLDKINRDQLDLDTRDFYIRLSAQQKEMISKVS